MGRYILSVLLLTSVCSYGQVDSLKKVALSIWQSDPEKGFELAETVYSQASEADDKLNISWVYNYKGIVFSAIGEMDSSYYYYNKSLAYCDEHGIEETKFKSLMNLARNYSFQGRYKEAIHSYLEVIKIFEARGDTLGLGHAYSGMGNIHSNLDNNNKAKSDYLKSIGYYNAIGKPQFTGILYSNLGVMYRDEGKLDSAIMNFNKAEAILTETNHLTGLGSLYLNEGGMYESRDPKKALEYFQKGHDLNAELDDKRGVMIAILGLAKAHYNLDNHQLSIQHATQGRKMSIQMEDLKHQEHFAKILYYNYKALGDVKNALVEIEEYKLLSDSILNLESAKAISELEVKYETEKIEKQLAEDALTIARNEADLAESQLSIRKGNTRLIIAAFLILLAGLIAVWIYRSQQAKRRQAEKEFEMRSELERVQNHQRIADEKVRISSELHDNIGAQLTFMINSVENLHHDSEGPVKGKLEKVSSFGRDTMHELRNTIWAMNQENGSTEVLTQKLAELKLKLSGTLQVNLKNNISPPVDLNAIQMLNAYRIVQEALQNALKYAEVSEVEIQLSSPNGQTQLKIQDKGKGFNLTETAKGNGLKNMTKRANSMGAKLNIDSIPNEGTSVILTF